MDDHTPAPSPALRLDLVLDRYCVIYDDETTPWYVAPDSGDRVLCYDCVREVWQGLPANTKRITFHVVPAAPNARSSPTTYVGRCTRYTIGAHDISIALFKALHHAGFHTGDRVACWVEY